MRALTKEQMLMMLVHYARGLRAQNIADVEHLSVHAVNNRLKRVKAHMGCSTTAEAVVKAIADGDILVYRRRIDSPVGRKDDLVIRLRNEAHEIA